MTATTMIELAQALVAYYPLMGDADDYSGHVGSATPTSKVTYEPGPFGSAAAFHRIGSGMKLPTVYPAAVGSYALSAWVRLDGYAPVAGDAAPVGTVIGCLGVRHEDGIIVFDFAFSGLEGSVQSIPLEATTRIELGDWTHIIAEYLAAEAAIRLLVNGRPVAEGPVPKGVTPVEPTLGRVGAAANDGSSGVLNGVIGHVALFKDDVSQACANALAGYMTYPVPRATPAGRPDELFTWFVVATVILALIPLANTPKWTTNLEQEQSAPPITSLETLAERIADVAGYPISPAIKVTRGQIGLRAWNYVKLDIGGYGAYREAGGVVSGLSDALNLNDKILNPNSSPPNQPIPALVLMPDWSGNPEYPFEDGFADYIIMQSAPLTPTNVKEIARVLRVGGMVGLWIDEDRFAPAIASLAQLLNCTPLRCSRSNGNLGMDEMKGEYVFPKLLLTKEASVSNPGTFTLTCGGGYVARLKVRYTLRGTEVTESTGDIPLGISRSLGVPAGATDIFVTAEEFTGFSWNEIGTHAFGAPVVRCYKCWGTTYYPKWAEIECDTVDAEAAAALAKGGEDSAEQTPTSLRGSATWIVHGMGSEQVGQLMSQRPMS